jgi:hypothetical protein
MHQTSDLFSVAHTTPFMIFSVTYTICKGHELGVYMSQSVTFINCQYDIICQLKYFFQMSSYLYYETSVIHWDS